MNKNQSFEKIIPIPLKSPFNNILFKKNINSILTTLKALKEELCRRHF